MPKKANKKAVIEKVVLSEEEKELLKKGQYDKYVSVFNNLSCMTPTNSKIDMLQHLAEEFEKYGEYYDSVELAKTCKDQYKEVTVEVKKFNYADGKRRLNEANTEEEFTKIRQSFIDMGDYLEAKKYVSQCNDQLKKIRRRDKYATARKFGILVIILLLLLSTKTNVVRYNAAKGFRKLTCYEKSANMFKGLKSYKDSKKRYEEATYQQAKYLYSKGKINKARDLFFKVNAYRDSAGRLVKLENEILEQSVSGQTVAIGANDYLVLERQGDVILLMKNKGMAPIQYSSISGDVTWENSTIRQYLNNEFLRESFCKQEIENIESTKVINKANAVYNTDGGNQTQDQVYLLSTEEANRYSAIINEKSRKIAWLRTPGAMQDAVSVYGQKQVNEYGYIATSDTISAYPVLWYKIN